MISVALIVFREVLEAALLLGVVFAATHRIPRRMRWILAGLGGGLMGAVAVAAGAEQLAQAAAGMGQELFNATVLFGAVVMLGWHTLWMKTHAKDLAHSTRALGQNISVGGQPLYALVLAVALAVLREGSEIVLFLHGIAAAGTTSARGIVLGSLLGLGGGSLLGTVLALGLLRVPMRHLFAITGGWIALFAAGMAAQGAAFLVQAGYILRFTTAAWDTSWLASDQSLVGQILRALMGYSASPMIIQVVIYAATLALFAIALVRGSGQPSRASFKVVKAPHGVALFGVAALGLMHGIDARADFKVYSPYVEQGEWEFEFRASRALDKEDSKDDHRRSIYEIGYSSLARWHTARFLEAEQASGESLEPAKFA